MMSRVRHTAVAVAGVASMGLTAAAASTVLSNMGVQLPGSEILFDRGGAQAIIGQVPAAQVPARPSVTRATTLAVQERPIPEEPSAEPIALAPTTVVEPDVAEVAQAPKKSALAATVQLDKYYVGAAVTRVRASVLGFDLSTNVLDVVPDLLAHKAPGGDTQNAAPAERDGVTQIATEFDARRGLNVSFTDPDLGARSLDIHRTEAV